MNKVVFKKAQCTIPAHRHRAPIQYMVGFQLGWLWIEITRDGDLYNIRVDEDSMKSSFGLSLHAARKILYFLFKEFGNGK